MLMLVLVCAEDADIRQGMLMTMESLETLDQTLAALQQLATDNPAEMRLAEGNAPWIPQPMPVRGTEAEAAHACACVRTVPLWQTTLPMPHPCLYESVNM